MKCTYCNEEVRKGQGTVYVYKTGNMSYFCSNRCYKYGIVIGRNVKRKVKKVAKPATAQTAKK